MNRILVSLQRHARVLAIAALAVGVAAANAQAPAGPHRPAGVPDGYLFTPAGFFHPSCVRQVAKHDTVLKDERAIRHADGTFESIPKCSYPRYRANGKLISEDTGTTINDAEKTVKPLLSGTYVEATSAMSEWSFGELTATWVVPPMPASYDGQMIAFWPGLQEEGGGTTVLE